MKILIFGSKGYIGSNLLTYFREKNINVYGSDVLTDRSDKKYFEISTINSNFDILFKTHCFDVCVNCSGASSVPNSFIDNELDFELNTVNVYKILNSIRSNNPSCKFINISSAAVYGNVSYIPVNEASSLEPISPYGFHKQMSEIIVSEFYKIYGIKTCSLRLFSVYGVGLKKQLLWDIFQKWKNNEILEFHGNGNETRDFIYIDDLIKLIDLIIKNLEFKGDVINVANGDETKIKDIVTLMLNELGERDYTFNNITRIGDPFRWKGDISKIQKIGYLKSVTIKEGIKKYVTWLKDLK
jgi:UDP-glucose 4-epimerase